MSTLHLLFRVGDVEYVVPAEDVLQVQAYEGVTALPGAPAHVTGLMQVRGRVVPVIDLRRRFGLAEAERPEARVVVVQLEGRTVGLLADSAKRVLDIEPERFAIPPEVVAREAAGFVRSVARVGERLVMQVELRQVVGTQDGAPQPAAEEQVHGRS